MPVTIEQLNKKYSEEDVYWDFKLFWGWLGKKGFSAEVITAALKKVLADYSPETLPEKHHDFDNAVKDIAFKLKDASEQALTKALETSVTEGYAQYEAEWNALGKVKKIWQVLTGKA